MTNLEKELIKAIVVQSKVIGDLESVICNALGVEVIPASSMYTITDNLTRALRDYSWKQEVERIIDTNDFINILYSGDADKIISILETMEKENGGILC